MKVVQSDMLSQVLYYVTGVAAVALPVFVVASRIIQPEPLLFVAEKTGLPLSDNVTDVQLWVSFLVGLAPMAALVWILLLMRRLFAVFAVGDALSDRAAQLIKRIGQWFVGQAALQFVIVPIQSGVLSWGGEVGTRSVSVAVSSGMMGALIAAGLLIVIGRALAQAADLAAENRAFI